MDAVIGAEPGPGLWLTGAEFDAALEALADFTDVKSPYTIGHSRGAADLAGEATTRSAHRAGAVEAGGPDSSRIGW